MRAVDRQEYTVATGRSSVDPGEEQRMISNTVMMESTI